MIQEGVMDEDDGEISTSHPSHHPPPWSPPVTLILTLSHHSPPSFPSPSSSSLHSPITLLHHPPPRHPHFHTLPSPPLNYPLLLTPLSLPLHNPLYTIPSITFSHNLLHHPLPSHSSTITSSIILPPITPSPSPYALNTLYTPYTHSLPSNNNVFFFRENSIRVQKSYLLHRDGWIILTVTVTLQNIVLKFSSAY